MKFIRDILLKGVFATMIDDRLDKRARNIAWICVTFLYACVITALILIYFGFEVSGGKIATLIILAVVLFMFFRLYIRLFIHLYKLRKEKESRRKEKEKIQAEENKNKVVEEEVEKKYRT